MKYKKVQLLKEAVQELGINQVEAAYKMGVRYETLHQMFKRGNIIIDGAVYQPTNYEFNVTHSGIKFLNEFLDMRGWTQEAAANTLGIKRQSISLMTGKDCIVYKGRIYSPKKYRLK